MEQETEPKQTGDGESPWVDLLTAVGRQVLPVLLTAGSLIGFVAFAGSVIVWTRFFALEVPPDQAVAAFPRSELVAIGASLLLILGFFGILAVLAVYLIDRGGRATPAMSRGLLILLMLEGLGAIFFVDTSSMPDRVIAAEILLLGMGTALWCTYAGTLVRHEKGQSDPSMTQVEELPKPRLFCGPDDTNAVPWPVVWRAVVVAGEIAVVAALSAALFGGTVRAVAIAGLAALGIALLLAVFWRWLDFTRSTAEDTDAEGPERHKEEKRFQPSERVAFRESVRSALLAALVAAIPAGLVTLVIDGFGPTVWQVMVVTFVAVFLLVVGFAWIRYRWRTEAEEGTALEEDQEEKEAEELGREEAEARHKELRERSRTFAGKSRAWRKRHFGGSKPRRLELTSYGKLAISVAMAVAVILPAVTLHAAWLVGSLISAIVLTVALWRISVLAESRFLWYGLAVFISVPLFGTLTWMARNLDDPQVQPVALIRETDGPDEAIQGLYVTEADERVYFATIGTEGCSREVRPHSGRLLWVPKSELVAMSIGPLQSVDKAARTSLEMSYALTPAVETPTGRRIDLSGGGETKGTDEGAASTGVSKRLEDVGPAVRPTFGAGLHLDPAHAVPGEEVTLRISEPERNAHVDGFGDERDGRTLRLGGVSVDVLKDPARSAASAEYVKARGGAELRIQKRTVYTWDGEGYAEADEPIGRGEARFVKVTDPAVAAVHDGDLAAGMYLRLNGADRLMKPTKKRKRPWVLMRDGRELPLEYGLRRQAWYEDHIKFEVPEEGSTGPVTVECDLLAGQPFLTVSRAPTARVAVRVRAGSRRVAFDARRSSDDGEDSLSHRWTVAGVRMGHGPRLATDLPPRLAPYTVRLTVTDSEGQKDTVALRLLRLPSSRFPFGSDLPASRTVVRRVQRAIDRAVRARAPAQIELHGHADSVGKRRFNLRLSVKRVETMRDKLFDPLVNRGDPVSMTVRAFGEACPIVPRPGRQPVNRRVEVFLLDQGATVATAKGCSPGHLRRTRW